MNCCHSRVGDRDPADPEGRDVDDVRGPLVVQRVRLVGGVDAEDERAAAGTSTEVPATPAGPAGSGRRARAAAARRAG